MQKLLRLRIGRARAHGRTRLQDLLAEPRFLAIWCVFAAFGAYASMYGFRKPFTAGSFSAAGFPADFKTWMILAQVLGYSVSKFIGIRFVSEILPHQRSMMILGLVAMAEVSLVLFAMVPVPWNLAFLFLNGLPLGMVFGLVLGFLEGRRMSEAFVAGLCASFILADGFSKSIGAWLVGLGVSELWMPAAAGLLFLGPLVLFVWMLSNIPAPDSDDLAARSARVPMNARQRLGMLLDHAPGIGCIVLAYLLITVMRSLRADFAPELWRSLGSSGQPSLFTKSELWVALGVVVANGMLVLVGDNQRAFRIGLSLCICGLILVIAALVGHASGQLGAFVFMVLMGLGLYVPYVAVHTTLFERMIAMTRAKGNVGYLMYLADSAGYFGYVLVMLFRMKWKGGHEFLTFFLQTSWIATVVALVALPCAMIAVGREGKKQPASATRSWS